MLPILLHYILDFAKITFWQLTEPNSSAKVRVFPCLGKGWAKPRGRTFILAITPFKIHGIWGSLVCQLLKVISCLPSMALTHPCSAGTNSRCFFAQLRPQAHEYTSTYNPPPFPIPSKPPGNHAWAYRQPA